MGKKRFYDAVRDLIRDDIADPPTDPPRSRRRLSIASLLSTPPLCAACWDPVPLIPSPHSCTACLSSYCPSCFAQYARSAIQDRSLLPLRCASPKCRAPVPFSALVNLLTSQEMTKLRRFHSELFAKREDNEGSESLNKLMDTMGWKRCPDCGTGVERTMGCSHMICVCGGEFCYSCGDRWEPMGVGCPRKCGWPGAGGEGMMGLLPARFDELRDEVWLRITALLERLRDHLETDTIETGWAHEAPGLREVARVERVRMLTNGVSAETSATSQRKMSVGSLVNPSRE